MGKFGTFEFGVDMPGDYWEREFSDRGLAGDLFTLLGGGLSKVSEVNREEKEKREKLALKRHEMEMDAQLHYDKLAQDEDQFSRKLDQDYEIAGMRHREDELVWWDPETGAEVAPEQPVMGEVGQMPAAGGFSPPKGCPDGKCGLRQAPEWRGAKPADDFVGVYANATTPEQRLAQYQQAGGVSEMPAAGAPSKPRRQPLQVRRGDVARMSDQYRKDLESKRDQANQDRRFGQVQERMDRSDANVDKRLDSVEAGRAKSEAMQRERFEFQERQANARFEFQMMQQNAQFAFQAGQADKGKRLQGIATLQQRAFELEDKMDKFRQKVMEGDEKAGMPPGYDLSKGVVAGSALDSEQGLAQAEPYFNQWVEMKNQLGAVQQEILAHKRAYEQVHGPGIWTSAASVQQETPPTHAGSGAAQAPSPESAAPAAPAGADVEAKVKQIMSSNLPLAEKRKQIEALRAPR